MDSYALPSRELTISYGADIPRRSGTGVRFDDTLETVLAADLGTPVGKQSAWRQLVDLIGRRRVPPDTRALAVLRRIRAEVALPVRVATARALEYAYPPAPLVRIFALDELAVALPVLRSARLNSSDWIQLLPDLAPPARSVLRHRRDLPPVVRRALDTYGPSDFILPYSAPQEEPGAAAAQEPAPVEADEVTVAEEHAEAAMPEAVDSAVDKSDSALAEEAAIADSEADGDEGASHEADVDSVVTDAAPDEPDASESGEGEMGVLEPRLPEIAASMRAGSAQVQAFVTEFALLAGRAPPWGGRETAFVIPSAPPAPLPPEQLFDWTEVLAAPAAAFAAPLPAADLPAAPPAPAAAEAEDYSFVALAGFAATLSETAILATAAAPAVQSGTGEARSPAEPVAAPAEAPQEQDMSTLDLALDEPEATDKLRESSDNIEPGESEGPFQIAEVAARIDAFWRDREGGAELASARPQTPAEHFRFETDSKGVIRWVEGASRAPIVGLSLDIPSPAAGGSGVDGAAAGAFRRRAGFSNARLEVDGDSDAAGAWLISAIPVFDPGSGRFTGYRGTARRPRVDERAEPVRPGPGNAADSLRQLVHELRTPTNAIAGFAEMIETQMLGPVADPYRDRAHVIRTQTRELLGAIDDLDLAARIDSAALVLSSSQVVLRPLLATVADDLAQLAELRGSWIALPVDDLAVTGDRRAVERLLARLLATLVSASGPGERIGIRTAIESDEMVAITIDRPVALSDYPGDSVLGIDDEGEDATLLGTGFALRLARNLARELGGSLVIEPESLTLRLPASVNQQVGQAHLN